MKTQLLAQELDGLENSASGNHMTRIYGCQASESIFNIILYTTAQVINIYNKLQSTWIIFLNSLQKRNKTFPGPV